MIEFSYPTVSRIAPNGHLGTAGPWAAATGSSAELCHFAIFVAHY